MIGYPLDCPQRDERLGWLGDALVTADEMLLNFDASVFLCHWLDGIRMNQNPADGDISVVSPRPYTPEEPDPTWSSAYPLMVWHLYVEQGDRRFLAGRGGHFNVGVLGAKYLIEALTEHGRPDAAFALATQTGYPSWASMLEGGRTTLSEFWDLKGSHNHAMLGSIDAWFYRTLAGIRLDEARPGYEHIVIRPESVWNLTDSGRNTDWLPRQP